MSEISNETVQAIDETLRDVERALERLRAGTYRSCQVCGVRIDDATLIASPLVANCDAHPELA